MEKYLQGRILTGNLVIEELKSWVPYKLYSEHCEWLYTGEKKFTEPFFGDTISACKSLPENCNRYKAASSLPMMVTWANQIDALAPTAIIFHVSRCGSTLVSQLLGLDDANIVLSEVPFFDALLRLAYKKQHPEAKTIDDYFAAAIKFYGMKKTGKEKHLFIKTDSWHLHFYEQLRKLFPHTPFILLYRNPFEAALSQQRQRGMHAVPGVIEPAVFGFAKDKKPGPSLDIYMAEVLESYFKKMIAIVQSDALVLAVNYAEGISTIMKKIIDFASLDISQKRDELFKERGRFHAKYPHELFIEKNEPVATPDYMLAVIQLYNRLKAL